MHQMPQCEGLYVGGLEDLDQPDLLDEAGITHILSVLEFDYCDYPEFAKYQRLLIQAEDGPHEDLLQYFSRTNAFIDQALASGQGAVLVHCAMGQSRSVTVVCAYLQYRQKTPPKQALEIVKEARTEAAPNKGFVEQLEVYSSVLEAANETSREKVHRDWLVTRLR